MGDIQLLILLLNGGKEKWQNYRSKLLYIYTLPETAVLKTLELELYYTEMDQFFSSTQANPFSPGRFITCSRWFSSSFCNKLRRCFWNPWQRQTFPEIFHTANIMTLGSLDEGSLRTLFWFRSNNDLAINISNNWEYYSWERHVGITRIISTLSNLTLWSTRFVKQNGGNT